MEIKIKSLGGFLVFSLPCKELRSCHSILTTSKKLKQTEKSTTLLRSSEKWSHRGKLLWKKLETVRHKASLTRPETTSGNQCWGRNTWTVIDKLLEAQCGQAWELKIPGGPSHRGTCMLFFYLQFYQALTVTMRENSPHASQTNKNWQNFLPVNMLC